MTRKIRKLPDFIIIGTAKSGTTSLYNYLKQHPDIIGSKVKEIHFFDSKFSKGINWYKMFFPLISTRKLTFEATANYYTYTDIPERIRNMNGNTKLIMIFREPLARAYSHWNEVYLSGSDNNFFAESGFLDFYLHESRYEVFLEKWFEYFSPSSFLFLKAEDLFLLPQSCIDKICIFLKIKQVKNIKFKKYNYKGSQLDEGTRDKFESHFKNTYDYMKRIANISWSE